MNILRKLSPACRARVIYAWAGYLTTTMAAMAAAALSTPMATLLLP